MFHYPPSMKIFTRKLRRDMTPDERHLWYDFLKHQSPRFRRQYAVPPYVLDFYCHALRLAIEIDGKQHHTDEGILYDESRTDYLAQQGIAVLRFTNEQIYRHFPEVCYTITKKIKARRQEI